MEPRKKRTLFAKKPKPDTGGEKELKKLAELEKQAQDYLAGWQRAQADYQNLRKRMSEEENQARQSAEKSLLHDLLAVVDNFNEAYKHLPTDLAENSWQKGIEHIKNQLNGFLENQGVKKIEALGKIFDPAFHEAVAEVESEQENGTIVEEVKCGYLYHDQVLRPAKVKTVKSIN